MHAKNYFEINVIMSKVLQYLNKTAISFLLQNGIKFKEIGSLNNIC